jgi:hypothetical protein
LQSRGKLAAENYSSLPQCGSSKRLQLRRQDLKSNDMAASEDGGGAAVAEALGRKISQWERSIRSIIGRRQGKDCSRGAAEAHWAVAGKDCSGGAAEAGFEQRARLNVAGQ